MPQTLYEGSYRDSKCKKFVLRLILFIVSVALSPLTIALALVAAVIPGSCFLIGYIVKACQEASETRQRIKDRIKKRHQR